MLDRPFSPTVAPRLVAFYGMQDTFANGIFARDGFNLAVSEPPS
jgi:hypothetical protein